MAERMCVAERRSRILDILVVKKQTTRSFLSEEFNVSLDTISREQLDTSIFCTNSVYQHV